MLACATCRLPPGVLARLEQIAATSDDQLDAMVREVPVPPDLLPRLSRISRVRRHRLPLRELSLAAAVLLAVGVGLLEMPMRTLRASDGRRLEVRGSRPGPDQAFRWPGVGR